MAKNDSKTKAFSTSAAKSKKSIKNKKRVRRKVVVSIFAVIALILVIFATLIIAKIIEKANDSGITPNSPSNENITYIPRDAGNVKMGNLILIDKNHPFDYAMNNLVASSYDNLPQGIVNLWAFKNNSANKSETKIQIESLGISAPTYELSSPTLANQICLEENTLRSFNQMMLDYCKTLDLSDYSSGSASKINVAWGWSHENDLQNDIAAYGNAFLSHADGKSITLKQVKAGNEQITITENNLKNNFKWVYNNAHKYGFIIRYPNACENHTGFNSEDRVHLRYIGIEHATYIFNNNICFEEYLELIRIGHNYNNPLMINSADGKTYNVYYVECSGKDTAIPVPKDSNYVISGDNMNGFIISVEK
jgi:hypothetical protein